MEKIRKEKKGKKGDHSKYSLQRRLQGCSIDETQGQYETSGSFVLKSWVQVKQTAPVKKGGIGSSGGQLEIMGAMKIFQSCLLTEGIGNWLVNETRHPPLHTKGLWSSHFVLPA